MESCVTRFPSDIPVSSLPKSCNLCLLLAVLPSLMRCVWPTNSSVCQSKVHEVLDAVVLTTSVFTAVLYFALMDSTAMHWD